MSNIDIIRAWKDEDYLNSLSEEQRSQLPDNPAGVIELPDEATETIAGGGNSFFTGTCNHVCDAITPEFNCFKAETSDNNNQEILTLSQGEQYTLG